jgi:heme oxygenase
VTGDVLRDLRTATAVEHEQVETALGLVDPGLDRARLAGALERLHAFWHDAEAGLDAWAARSPADAAALDWDRRRRTALYAADVRALGGDPRAPHGPGLPPVRDTDEALGRLYVLEGSTLGGTFVDRHLATLPGLPRLRSLTPYGEDTGAMWAAFRRATRQHVAGPGDAARVVAAARTTFAVLAAWCSSPAEATPVRATPV